MGADADDKTKNKGRNKGDDDGGDDGDGGDDDADKPMTAKQVNAAITKAVRGVERRVGKSFADTLKTTLAEAGIGKAKPADDDDEGDDGDDDDPPAKPAAKPAEQPPARKGKSKAEKELAKLRAEMDALKTQAETEKAKAQRAELKRATTDLLTAAGVRKEAVPLLTTHLLSEDGGRRIRLNDDGQAVFVMGDGDDAEELSLKDGITAWAKTDEGKAYLSPKQAAGTGNGQGVPGVQPRTVGQPAGANGQQVQATAAANRDLFNAVMGEMGGFIIGGDGQAPAQQ